MCVCPSVCWFTCFALFWKVSEVVDGPLNVVSIYSSFLSYFHSTRNNQLIYNEHSHSGFRRHNVQRTIKTGSWFRGLNLNLGEALKSIYYWSVGFSIKQLRRELPITKATAVNLFSFLREICASVSIKHGDPVGGRDKDGNPIIVEIDESKFGKVKYNRVCIYMQQRISMRGCVRLFVSLLHPSLLFQISSYVFRCVLAAL